MTVMLEHRPNASAAMYPLTGVTIIGAWASGVPRARAWTVETLTKWKMPHLADSAEYVVSELVTNAIKASQYTWQATVTVWILSQLPQRQSRLGVALAAHDGSTSVTSR
jgi:hypothetical protein